VPKLNLIAFNPEARSLIACVEGLTLDIGSGVVLYEVCIGGDECCGGEDILVTLLYNSSFVLLLVGVKLVITIGLEFLLYI
jgi:hypothetical protein